MREKHRFNRPSDSTQRHLYTILRMMSQGLIANFDFFYKQKLPGAIHTMTRGSTTKKKSRTQLNSFVVYPEGLEPPAYWSVANRSIR